MNDDIPQTVKIAGLFASLLASLALLWKGAHWFVTVGKMRDAVEQMDAKLDDIGNRLIRVETIVDESRSIVESRRTPRNGR